MNFLDLILDDIIEVINKNLIEAQSNERKKKKRDERESKQRKNE